MSEPITRELREYINALADEYHITDSDHIILLDKANDIESEHERRMLDCRREVRRDLVRYLRGVLTDYDRGIKRVRKCDKAEVVRCRDCRYVTDGPFAGTSICTFHKNSNWVDADDYCSHGVRRDDADS